MGEEEGKAQGLMLKVSPGLRGGGLNKEDTAAQWIVTMLHRDQGLSLAEPKETQRLVLGLSNGVKR